jgi:hypothetical protein
VLNGDWTRAVTSGASKTLPVRTGGHAGIFLDPPYAGDVRVADLYSHDDHDVAKRVRAWCHDHGDDPQLRIVLAGFDTEHAELEARGWRCVEWFRAGFLKGGMGNLKTSRVRAEGGEGGEGTITHQQHRERLWLSPHCLHPAAPVTPRQGRLFG